MPDSGAEPIDPALARKLDAFTVPPLPAGFAERLAQQAASLPPEASSAAPLPRTRRAMPRRRWRAVTTGLGALTLGMMSISAAAAGWLGEPLREAVGKAPVLGPAIVSAVERVVPARLVAKAEQPAKPVFALKPEVPAVAPDADNLPDQPLAAPNRAEPRRLLADPAARRAWLEAHPRAAQRIDARQEARREWIETHPRAAERIAEVRAAREAGATPRELRRLRREKVIEAREQRSELRSSPQAEITAQPPAARIAEPPAGPSVEQPETAASAAPLDEPAAGPAQRRIERRELIQERRERRRQRMERLRP